MMKRFLLASIACLMASTAFAQDKPFRLCTGGDAGNYFKAGHILKSKSTGPIDVLTSQGSLDNLDKMVSGACDGGFVQADALLVYSQRNAKAISGLERAGVLYPEHVHLVCNRNSGIGRVTDLNKTNTIAIGPDGSGARTTWDAFVMADKKRYGAVQTDRRSGVRALSAVEDGSQVQCALWVGGLGSSFMRDDASKKADRVILVPTDDWDMGGVAKDPRGKPVYGYSEIPSETYKGIQPGGVFSSKAVKTITTDALFVVNVQWAEDNSSAYDKLLRAFASAKPTITQLAGPVK